MALADEFARQRDVKRALETLMALLRTQPHNAAARERYVRMYFEAHAGRFAPGTAERARMIHALLDFDVSADFLEDAYFENLERQLVGWPRLEPPGHVVLGLGCGRCGSTTLAAMLSRAAGCCATHETPPPVHWSPAAWQVRFHLRRFERLRQAFPVVFDAAHWWLNLVDDLAGAFESLKLVGLMREPEACAASFLKVKGSGRHAINHWMDHDGAYWKPALWDSTYPSYTPEQVGIACGPDPAPGELDRLHHTLVRTYVADYNAALERLSESWGERMLLLRTEALGEPSTAREIGDFLGLEVPHFEAVLNRATTADGDAAGLRF